MLLNRKASTDPSKDTLNVWTAAVPLGPTAKLEMVGAHLFINCARTLKDFRLHFTESVDVERMNTFCQYDPSLIFSIFVAQTWSFEPRSRL